MSVVLPAPLRPIRPVIEPAGSSSDTPRRMCTDAIDTSSRSIAMHAAPARAPPVTWRCHVGVLQHRGRRVGDDAAVVEREHALRVAAHDVHVVLDEQHRCAFRRAPRRAPSA